MSLLAQIASLVVTGGQATASIGLTASADWTIQRVKTGGKKKDMEELIDEDGALKGILVYQRHELLDLTLVSKAATGTVAQALEDFPDGDCCTLTGLLDYLVESCDIELTKSVVRVNVSLRHIGLTS